MAIHSEYISPQFASSQKNEMKKELCDTDEDGHPFSNSIFNNRKTRGKETEEIEIEHEYSYEHGKVHKKLHGSERRQRRRAKESDRQDLGHRYRNDTEKHDDEKDEDEEEEEEEKEERRYNIYNSLSVKEMSDEEISSENEYNRKLKKKDNFFLNDKKEKPSTSSTTSTSTSSLISNDVIHYLNDTTKLNEEFQRKKNKWNYNILSDSENKHFNLEELKYKKEDGSGNSNNINKSKNTSTSITTITTNNNNSNNNNNNVTNGNFDNNVKNNEPMNNIFSQLIVNENTQPQKEKISHNVDEWINKLFKCELLHSEEIKLMCELLIDILKEEENCVQVRVPVTVAGDIHGQFYDLLELFHIGGLPPDVNYLFLGDYVDRGYYSCECFCLVACFKIKYPSNVTLLRGNHESRQITKVYGFYDECMRKYSNDNKVWKYLTDAFDYLPLTAIINNKIFCDHGGISPHLKTIEDINKLNRFNEVPQDGAICDLLWSDPAGPEEETFDGWRPSPRGAGVLFSENVTTTFLRKNDLCYICRAHQLVQDGYQWMHNDKVVTIFSAPNYCYRCGNCASLMFVDELMEKQFITFNTAPLRASAQTLRRNVDFML